MKLFLTLPFGQRLEEVKGELLPNGQPVVFRTIDKSFDLATLPLGSLIKVGRKYYEVGPTKEDECQS